MIKVDLKAKAPDVTITSHEYFLFKRDQEALNEMRNNPDYVYITYLSKEGRKRLEIFKPNEISSEITELKNKITKLQEVNGNLRMNQKGRKKFLGIF